MTLSSSPKYHGLVLDANVLSILARVDRMDLLWKFAKLSLYVSPVIYRELVAGVERGVDYLTEALRLIEEGRIQVLAPEWIEQQAMESLPASLAQGEAEAIILCRRRDMIFITHDRKAANYCDRSGIACIRLRALLALFQEASVLTEAEVQAILS
jgi:predicted nucleic acid-binding protein